MLSFLLIGNCGNRLYMYISKCYYLYDNHVGKEKSSLAKGLFSMFCLGGAGVGVSFTDMTLNLVFLENNAVRTLTLMLHNHHSFPAMVLEYTSRAR